MRIISGVKRLGLNQGRYQGEGIDIAEYLREFHAAASARGWSSECFAVIDGFALYGYRRITANSQRTIYLSTGIHGDEPAGPVAMRRLVEEDQWPVQTDLILCPCINPTGFVHNTRENKDGIDLNRDYRHLASAEVRGHTAWLQSLPKFDLNLVLHEDWEAEGFYVYEVNWDNLPSPAERILTAVREMCPIQPNGKVDNLWDCVDGVIRPQMRPEDRPLWAEAIYLIVHKSRLGLTLEAPSDFPLPFRAEAHVRAVRAALTI